MTYREISKILSDAGICDAEYEAALLLFNFCGIDAAKIPLVRDVDFDSKELKAAVEKRKKRYPLQYIFGEWGFYGKSFALNSDCLIPRPDTELLVMTAAEILPRGACFIDAGTGSGCISVSLLCQRGDLTGTAFDISEGALDAARKNAKSAGVADRLNILAGDMTSRDFWLSVGCYDAVISNPPYIPTSEIDLLEPELKHEPKRALDGGVDGLDFYRALLEFSPAALKDSGVILLEVGAGQADEVSYLAAECGFSGETRRDLGGHSRVLILRRMGSD